MIVCVYIGQIMLDKFPKRLKLFLGIADIFMLAGWGYQNRGQGAFLS